MVLHLARSPLALAPAALVMAFFACWSIPAGAQSQEAATGIAIYKKKSISIFCATTGGMVNAFTAGFRQLGRFDYHPIKFAAIDSLDEFIVELRRHKEAHAATLASEGRVADLKFRDIVLSGADLDSVINASYILVPHFQVARAMDLSPEEVEIDTEGRKTIYVKVTAFFELRNQVYDLAEGLPIADQYFSRVLARRIEVVLKPNEGSEMKKRLLADFHIRKVLAAQADPAVYFASELPLTVNGMMREVTTAAKLLDPFLLKSYVTVDPKGDQVEMVFGRDVGVEQDSTWWVKKKIKTPIGLKFQDAGFVRVRQISENESKAQLIGQWRTFSRGDQLIEVPKRALDISLRGGVSSFNGPVPSISVLSESNLGALMNSKALSETYLFAAGDSGPTPGVFAYKVVGGLKKRHYFRQFIVSVGGGGGVAGGLGSSGEVSVTGSAPGAGVLAGAEYQFSPDLKLGAELGYFFFLPIVDWQGRVKKDQVSRDLGRGFLPEGLPGGRLDSTGPTAALSITFLL